VNSTRTDANTIFISSHVKLPENTTSQEVYKYLAIAVEVNIHTSVIMKAEITLVTKLGRDFISQIVCGYNMNDGIDGLLQMLNRHYFGHAKKAIGTGFKLVFDKYEEIIAKHE
jgi:hypothetical protein